jgi:putative ABC transport system permease protein
MRVPLAWLSLIHDKRRLLASIAGITGAVVLMFMQFGFLNALRDGQVELIRRLDADLVIVSRLKYTLAMNAPFPRRRLFQARAVDGVRSVRPLWLEMTSSVWKNPGDARSQPIRVLGFDPELPVFRDPEVQQARAALTLPETALFDVKSRGYGAVTVGTRSELAGQAVRVVGVFRLGPDFTAEGNVIVSDRNFARYFPSRAAAGGELESVELGVVGLEPGAAASAVQRSLRQALPDDVTVLTPDELTRMELAFWEDSVPIGAVFGLGAVMGFLIGVIICYQILFADVTDHLPQMATLKAIGYANGYLVRVVVQQALVLSALAFTPGVLLTLVLYRWLAGATGLPMVLTLDRVGLVLALTGAMTVLAALFAVRKAVAADPAEVF